MEILSTPSTSFLLERSLEDLHHSTLEWIDEIRSWKDETVYLQKILEQNSVKVTNSDKEGKIRIEQLQNRLLYYHGEVLAELYHDMKAHKKHMAIFGGNFEKMDEQAYRREHVVLHDRFSSCAKSYKDLKTDLYEFVTAYAG